MARAQPANQRFDFRNHPQKITLTTTCSDMTWESKKCYRYFLYIDAKEAHVMVSHKRT